MEKAFIDKNEYFWNNTVSCVLNQQTLWTDKCHNCTFKIIWSCLLQFAILDFKVTDKTDSLELSEYHRQP